EMGVGEPHLAQLGREQPPKILLFLGRRASFRRRIGLGVDHDITQEALGHGVRKGEGCIRGHGPRGTRNSLVRGDGAREGSQPGLTWTTDGSFPPYARRRREMRWFRPKRQTSCRRERRESKLPRILLDRIETDRQ